MNLRNRLPFLLYASKYQDLIVEGTDKLDLQDALKDWLYYVNAYGKSVQSNVPYDYRELEYIESTGTQYIDTGIVPTLDYEFEIKAKKTVNRSLIGSGSDDYVLTGGNGLNYLYQGASQTLLPSTIDNTLVHTWAVKNGYLYCDSDSVAITSTPVTPTNSFALFARKTGSTTFDNIGAHTIYYAKIWNESGILVFNGIPCINPTGQIGIYDTITQQFFANAGTGEFIAGPEIVTLLPSPCVRIDYVDMQAGSYALTNIIPKSDYNIEIDFKTTTVQSQNTCYFGTRSSTSSGSGISAAHTNTGEYVFDVFGQRFSPTEIFANNTRYLYSYNNGTVSLSSGGSVLYTNTTTPTDIVTHPFIINALNNMGTVYGNYEGIYLYSFKVRDNTGKLIADYVPARINALTVLYDCVTNQIIMQDTGTWGPGPDTTITYIPTSDNPIDIWCNNGALKASINEFNANAITNGYFYNADLEWVANSSVYTTDYMKTVKGKYTLVLGNVTTVTTTVNIRVNLFNANNIIQSQTVIPITSATTEYTYEIDIPDGISSVRISTNPTFVVVSSFNNSNSVYADGTVETLQLVGKNLFDKNNTSLTVGQYLHIDTHDVRSGTNELSVIYQLVPGKTYTLTRLVTGASIKMRVGFFDTATPTVGTIATDYQINNDISATSITFTVPEGKPYMFATLANSTNSGRTITEQQCIDAIQIEKGSTATTYQPYTGDTATCEDLLSLDNYTDEQEIISGVVTRKVGVKVLDGTEEWTWTDGTYSYFRLNNANIGLAIDKADIYCTHFVRVPGGISVANNNQGISLELVSNVDTIKVRLNDICTASEANIPTFKAWLADQYAAGTPVIIVYPLATETTSIIPEQPLQLENGNNVLQIIEASLDHLKLEAKYRKRK